MKKKKSDRRSNSKDGKKTYVLKKSLSREINVQRNDVSDTALFKKEKKKKKKTSHSSEDHCLFSQPVLFFLPFFLSFFLSFFLFSLLYLFLFENGLYPKRHFFVYFPWPRLLYHVSFFPIYASLAITNSIPRVTLLCLKYSVAEFSRQLGLLVVILPPPPLFFSFSLQFSRYCCT